MIRESIGRRLEYAIRTVYPCTVCLLLSLLFSWGGKLTFLSVILSVVGAVRHFGRWQLNAWGILNSCLIGAVLGTIIGLITGNTIALSICLFVAIIWVDRCSAFQPLSRVLTLVAVILGAVFPSMSNNQVIGIKSFITLLMIMYIPFAVIGFTLLFPFPSLAADAAKKSVGNICKYVDRIVRTQAKAYCNIDLREFYLSDVENIIDEFLYPEIELLEELIPFIEYEAIVFPSLVHLAPSLRYLITIVRSVLIHANLQRSLIRKSVENATHLVFLYHLEPVLHSISTDIRQALDMVATHIVSNNRTCIDDYWDACNCTAVSIARQFNECLMNFGSIRDAFNWPSIRYHILRMWVVSVPWRGRREVDAFAFNHIRRTTARLNSNSKIFNVNGVDNVTYTAAVDIDARADSLSGVELELGMGQRDDAGPIPSPVAGAVMSPQDTASSNLQRYGKLVSEMEAKKTSLLYGYHCLRQIFIFGEYYRWAHFNESFSDATATDGELGANENSGPLNTGPKRNRSRAFSSHLIGIDGDCTSVLHTHSSVADLQVLGDRVASDNHSLGLLNLG